MKLANAIKKLEKQGFKVTINENNKNFHLAKKPNSNQVIEFVQNGGSDEIVCIRTKRENERDDSMTDYFPGTWHDNITQAIKFVGAY